MESPSSNGPSDRIPREPEKIQVCVRRVPTLWEVLRVALSVKTIVPATVYLALQMSAAVAVFS